MRRSTADLLILMVAGTICVALLISVIAIGLIELINPAADTTSATDAIGGVLSTLVGLLAGYLAGRTQRFANSESNLEVRRDVDSDVE